MRSENALSALRTLCRRPPWTRHCTAALEREIRTLAMRLG